MGWTRGANAITGSNDGRLVSRWSGFSGVVGVRTLLVPADKDRIAINVTAVGLFSGPRWFLGGPDGPLAVLFQSSHPAEGWTMWQFNADESPELAQAEWWLDANPNPGDGGIVEVWCCKDVR